ncbi:STN domain-containing protein [Chitinophaga sedimenti]|uniref:STN domain-containing protein n=1 Tax=Chitinophaga sedimenti TaxID=2033606 RepID=UPI0020054C0D|nr:STN domain-containing protein [Chitinophaga sedimenti]MCK7555013.1 STN domain-containing protein [Chitinophaga sedimenti]
MRITVSVKDAPLTQVLQKALAGTPLNFAIDGNRVYVVKERTIRLSLPEEYFVRRVVDLANRRKTRR